MHMTKACWTFVLILCIPSCAEDRFIVAHGTFLTWVLKNDSKLIVAADSRVVRWDKANPTDNECKIIRLGPQSIFAASGFTSARTDKEKNIEVASDIARDAFRMYPHDARKMAAFWAENIMKTLFVVASRELLEAARNQYRYVVIGLFAVASDSLIDTWQVRINYENDKMNAGSILLP
jgi:hypothetical protein